jgi:hypothetical protein
VAVPGGRMNAEEISGTGYARRPITWTTVEANVSASDLVAAQEQAEAENIAAVLRRFAELFEDGDS